MHTILHNYVPVAEDGVADPAVKGLLAFLSEHDVVGMGVDVLDVFVGGVAA